MTPARCGISASRARTEQTRAEIAHRRLALAGFFEVLACFFAPAFAAFLVAFLAVFFDAFGLPPTKMIIVISFPRRGANIPVDMPNMPHADMIAKTPCRVRACGCSVTCRGPMAAYPP